MRRAVKTAPLNDTILTDLADIYLLALSNVSGYRFVVRRALWSDHLSLGDLEL